ncbi:protein dbf4 [Anaeramoeba ignava]|uniref:Protein dbf4 n=1 Tax=Anaeramoeba ignava TaxID=1746090 RepID=A0A9Q0RHJ5_ANAIG|nr:protein dbf4 [Anaeramoeba ignava]
MNNNNNNNLSLSSKYFYLSLSSTTKSQQITKKIQNFNGNITDTLSENVNFYISDDPKFIKKFNSNENKNSNKNNEIKKIIENLKSWKTRVLNFDQVDSYLDKVHNLVISSQNTKVILPFISIVDITYFFKPSYKECVEDPLPDLNTFYKKRPKQRRSDWNYSMIPKRKTTPFKPKQKNQPIKKKTKKNDSDKKFCEICNEYYLDRKKHTNSQNHKSLIPDEKEYVKVDILFQYLEEEKEKK